METFERIQLAFKCPKALDELQPCESNWYCDGCQQMVYDFRGFTEETILNTFAENGQKLCGIYDANRIKVLPQQRKWYKLVPAAMLLTGLAACSNAASIGKYIIKNPKQPVADTPLNHHLLGEPIIQTGKIKLNNPKADTNMVFGLAIEIVPTFPGGEIGFKNYVRKHLNYSGDFKGRVFVSFVVEEDGTLSDIKIIKGSGPELDKKIIELMKNCPHWIPGIQNGKKYRSAYTLPINIQ